MQILMMMTLKTLVVMILMKSQKIVIMMGVIQSK